MTPLPTTNRPATTGPCPPRAPVPVRQGLAPALLLAVSLSLGACASTPREAATGAAANDADHVMAPAAARPSSPARTSAPTLYDELGGKHGVASLVERFIREIAADERVRGHYRDSDMGRFYRMMQAQMCESTGGDCTYEGDDMRRTHGGMNITPTEFNAIVEALMRAMDAEGLPVGVQNRLLALYAPMREDIIDR